MSVSLRYRPDIDGLRALAVIGVIAYHAFPKCLPGGFVGVDIFFVISGYLISGILYKGHSEGSFSFREFYARRIRRLFPSLITVLVLCLAYGWVVLLPAEYEKLGKHVAAGTLFIQNFVFWGESGYFDTAANLKPLLHLWSLAVEEQFYIIFPLLLVILLRKPKFLVSAMAVLLVASLLGNVVMSTQNPATDFFLTPYRAWEFLGGSLLAWWHFDKGHEKDTPRHREVMSWAGVILMLLGMSLLTKDQPYPGWRALLPVCGTLLVMEGRGAWVNRKILSNSAVVWIGLISYPLYLFHWPALSFVHIVKGQEASSWMIMCALGVALLLSLATYYGIEKKLRSKRSTLIVPMLCSVFLGIGILGLVGWKGIFQQKKSFELGKIEVAIKDDKMLKGLPATYGENGLCMLNMGGNGPQTLFFGDSNMQQYAPRIEKVVRHNERWQRGAIFLTAVGSPPIPNMTHLKREACKKMLPMMWKCIQEDKRIDRVVIAALWPRYFGQDTQYYHGNASAVGNDARNRAIEDFGIMIRKLVQNGKKVTVVLSIPFDSSLDPLASIKRGFWGVRVVLPKALTVESFNDLNGELLQKICETSRRNGAEIIDPIDYLAINGVCIFENEGIPIRYNYGHLRPGYVREHLMYLDNMIKN